MAETILSENQRKVLEVVSQDAMLCESFYLTGGTALAEYYLQHRLSEDLDFFSEQEVDTQSIAAFFAKNKARLGIRETDFQQSFNRNLFFVSLEDDVIKTEFTYFPFPRIEQKLKKNDLFIDSLEDIAANKLFTIYQKPRSRDFIDLYLILQKTGQTLDDLIKKTTMKFDWHIDYLQLGSQFLLAETVKDYPHMLADLELKVWQTFFLDQAKGFREKIIK